MAAPQELWVVRDPELNVTVVTRLVTSVGPPLEHGVLFHEFIQGRSQYSKLLSHGLALETALLAQLHHL